MTERALSARRAVWPWLLALAVALVAGLLLLPERGVESDEASLADWELLGDRKLQRTAQVFSGEPAARTPLADYNHEGIALHLDFDAGVLASMRPLHNRRYYKDHRSQASVRFGDGPPHAATVALRGAGSLDHPELLSFKVRLARAERFAPDVELRRFFVMAGSEDPHHIEARLAAELLREVGLFPLYRQFVSLYLNGDPQGVAILLEPADRGIRRLHPNATAVYRRRGTPNEFRTYWTRGDVAATNLVALRALNDRERIDDPVHAYSRVLDLDAYLAFLASAAILANGDTLGELFLFETRSDAGVPQPLGLVAWDLEDVGYGGPNEAGVDDPLLFFAEGRIDEQIHRHPELWARYRRVLGGLLDGPLAFERVAAKLLDVQAMRDAIDDGHPAVEQQAARDARALHVEAELGVFRGRNEHLRAALAVAAEATDRSPR